MEDKTHPSAIVTFLRNNAMWLITVLVLIALLVLFGKLIGPAVQPYVAAIEKFARNNREWLAPLVFVLAFGESIAFISLILPFWGLLVALGALIGQNGLEFFLLIWVAASLGAALGDWVSYWLGYHYHEQIARMWPLNRHPDLLPRGHAFFEKWGVWAIVIGRFSGPLRASVPLIAGMVEMPRLKFQIANFGSAFLWAFVLLVFGEQVGKLISAMVSVPGWK